MIAVDTNLLVYASRRDLERHELAKARLLALAEGAAPWCIPWPCVHEFIGTVTRARYFDPPTAVREAIATLEAWRKSPSLRFIGEGPAYFETFKRLLLRSEARGPRVHDARIAAICLSHGVSTLWTADRDFVLFPELNWENPLLM